MNVKDVHNSLDQFLRDLVPVDEPYTKIKNLCAEHLIIDKNTLLIFS